MNKNSARQQRYADDSPETYCIQTSNAAGRRYYRFFYWQEKKNRTKKKEGRMPS
jgi:hypothetical protein